MFEYPSLPALGLMAGLCYMQAASSVPSDTVSIEICSQHGCARQVTVQVDQPTLMRIGETFAAVSTDPAQERIAIAHAIALLEQYVGNRTGTDRDLGGTFPGAFHDGQMDCVDEATNTTRYLRLFAQQGWLRWHDIAEPASRLPIPKAWWPHTTAVVRETATGHEFAVDSWFEVNGKPPHIVELRTWRRGWKPSAQQP